MKHTRRERWLALLLTLIMMLSLVPTAAYAEGPDDVRPEAPEVDTSGVPLGIPNLWGDVRENEPAPQQPTVTTVPAVETAEPSATPTPKRTNTVTVSVGVNAKTKQERLQIKVTGGSYPDVDPVPYKLVEQDAKLREQYVAKLIEQMDKADSPEIPGVDECLSLVVIETGDDPKPVTLRQPEPKDPKEERPKVHLEISGEWMDRFDAPLFASWSGGKFDLIHGERDEKGVWSFDAKELSLLMIVDLAPPTPRTVETEYRNVIVSAAGVQKGAVLTVEEANRDKVNAALAPLFPAEEKADPDAPTFKAPLMLELSATGLPKDGGEVEITISGAGIRTMEENAALYKITDGKAEKVEAEINTGVGTVSFRTAELGTYALAQSTKPTPRAVRVNVSYVDEAGKQLLPPATVKLPGAEEERTELLEAPEIAGYAVKESSRELTIPGWQTEEMSAKLVYVPATTLTIYYVDALDQALSPTETRPLAILDEEQILTIEAPEIEGYVPDEDTLTLTVPAGQSDPMVHRVMYAPVVEEDPYVYDILFDNDEWRLDGDSEADLENYTMWDEAFADMEFTGNWAEDLLAVAKTQLGYSESANNYAINRRGDRNGYTRYGAWYGMPYGEWCAMFISFCLRYAQVDKEAITVNSSCPDWIEELTEDELYVPAGEYIPRPGDLIFYDKNEDDTADHVGIVAWVDANTATIHSIEGNVNDSVAYAETSRYDEHILGFGLLPENPDYVPDTRIQRTLQGTIGGHTVTVSGLLPADAELSLAEIPMDTAAAIYSAQTGEETAAADMVFAIDVTILVNGVKFEPETFDDKVKVIITNVAVDPGRELDLLHVKSDVLDEEGAVDADKLDALTETPAETENIPASAEGSTVSFEAGSFTPYIAALRGPAPGTLQYIINSAADGGTVTLDQDWQENIVIPNAKTITLDLNGHSIQAVEGATPITAVTVNGTLQLTDSAGGGKILGNSELSNTCGVMVVGTMRMDGGTITGFTRETNGGGVYVAQNGQFTMSGGEISGNTAGGSGGGVYTVAPENLSLLDSALITGNTAQYGGGIAYGNAGTIELTGGTVTGNNATANGGGLYFASACTVTFNGIKLEGNASRNHGGGAWFASGSKAIVDGSNITGNSAGVKTETERVTGYGGGFYLAAKSTLTLESGSIAENTAYATGGGAYMASDKNNVSTFVMTGGALHDNSAILTPGGNSIAGGLYLGTSGRVAISGGEIHHNKAVRGAGLYFNSTNSGTIANCKFHDNTIDFDNEAYTGHGGGFYAPNNGHSFTIRDCEFYNNGGTGKVTGGGFRIDNGTTTVTGCNIHDNSVTGNDADNYGGFYAGGSLTLENTHIYNNTAGGSGGGFGANTVTVPGGLLVENNKSLVSSAWTGGGGCNVGTIRLNGDAVFQNNTAGYCGGGIYCWNITINSDQVLITENRAGAGGGGVYQVNGVVTMHAGKITKNTSGSSGGGICLTGTSAGTESVFDGGIISENTASNGGGICAYYYNYTVGIRGDVRILDNVARSNGGGIYAGDGGITLNMSGGTITGNRAGSMGGGIGFMYLARVINITGGTLADNTAANGRDIGGTTNQSDTIGTRTKLSVCAATDMGGNYPEPVWRDEIKHVDVTEAFNNDADLERDGGVNYYYTFTYKLEEVAQIGETIYDSLQAAFDAIKDGTASGTDVILLVDDDESVILPEGITATLDLNGKTVTGLARTVETENADGTTSSRVYGSVFYIPAGTELTVLDSSEAGTGTVTGGTGLAGKNSSGATVRLGGGFFVNGKLTLQSGTIKGNRGSGGYSEGSGGGVYVNLGGTFIMDGGTISGNTQTGITAGNAYMYPMDFGAPSTQGSYTVVINGGTIRANGRAGIYTRPSYGSGSTLTINGGLITGHTGAYTIYSAFVPVTINGGEISGNTITGSGGGLQVYSTTLTMTGGEIKNNRAAGHGGGVHISGNNSLTITGGSICDNTAGTSGGGIYNAGASTVFISGTEDSPVMITGNTAGEWGGGIDQVDSTNVTVTITGSNVHIRDNTASAYNGGGIFIQQGIRLEISGGVELCENKAGTPGTDLCYPAGTQIKVLEDASEMDGYQAWLDEQKGLYYTDAAEQIYPETPNAAGYHVAEAAHYMRAVKTTVSDPVARIGDTEYSLVNVALNAAQDGETVYLLRDWTESVVVPAGKTVTLDLNGYTLSSEGGQGISVRPDCNFTLDDTSDQPDHKEGGQGTLTPAEGADAGRGVMISARGTFTLRGGTITGYSGMPGGGVYVYGANSRFQMEGGTITDCSSTTYGGGVYVYGANSSFKMEGGTIANCSAATHGGGVAAYNNADGHSIEISGGAITGCTARSGSGGGVFMYNNGAQGPLSFVMTGGTVTDCSAPNGNGGGIYIQPAQTAADSIVRIEGASEGDPIVVSGNSAKTGGGVYIAPNSVSSDATTVTVRNLRVEDNHATGDDYGGLAIGTHKSVTVENVSAIGNSAVRLCAGFYFVALNEYDHHMTVSNVLAEGNTAGARYGGGHIGGNAVVDNVRVLNNTATGGDSSNGTFQGGGLSLNAGNGGVLEASNLLVEGNKVTYGYFGGGLRIAGETGTVTVRDSVIRDNSLPVRGYGGGVFIQGLNSAATKVTLANCQILDNRAPSYGGGIYCASITTGAEVNIIGGEIAGNTGTYGGGFYMEAFTRGTVNIDGTHIHDNTATSNDGGGVYIYRNLTNTSVAEGTLNITGDTVIEGNNAPNGPGGGIHVQGADLNIGGNAQIRGNTATSGGGVYYYCGNFTMTGGSIAENTATTNVGGGIYATAGANYPTIFNMTGGEITGNKTLATPTATSYVGSGAGAYIGNYTTATVSGGIITGNVANGRGGGVCTGYPDTTFTLTGEGQLYGNTAALGQDVYARWATGYAGSRIDLMTASDMFADDDSKTGIAWWDEQRDNTYENGFHYTLMREYPLTLNYTDDARVVAVIELDGNTLEFSTVQAAVDYVETNNLTGKTIKMVDDSIESVVVPVSVDTTLNLNGHKLQGKQAALTVAGKLRIEDVKADGDETSGEGTGTISGNAVETGGGVHVVSGGSVVMTGGEISGCRAQLDDTDTAGGAGVSCDGGSFELQGGAIKNNNATYGGGVLVRSAGTFLMSGGEISGNTATKTGGGIRVNSGGKAIITGGEIKDNSAKYGGGVGNSGGKLTITGTEDAPVVISGNTASDYGGGVFSSGSTSIGHTQITDNSVSATDVLGQGRNEPNNSGGGMAINGGTTTIMDGTVISGNSAPRGGGVALHGNTNGTGAKLYMTGGLITENSAKYGGGVYQDPLRYSFFSLTNGGLYGNTSTVKNTGNDLYSFYEGSGDYPGNRQEATMPTATAMAVTQMGNPNYSVWRDDDYTGGANLTEEFHEGFYINAPIPVARNLLLTASSFTEDDIIPESSDFMVNTLTISTSSGESGALLTGSTPFDSGAAAIEVTAGELLDLGEATESDQTYVYNGVTYNYVSYNGVLYEHSQAVTWSAGDDASADNAVVRTFDTVNYHLNANIVTTLEPGQSGADPSELVDVMLAVEAILPCDEDEAVFSISDNNLLYSITSRVINGKTVQVLRGYYKEKVAEGTNLTKSLGIRVKGMLDGETLKPEFKMWIIGNDENTENPAECASKTLTVSAKGKYNVTLLNNGKMVYTGYFDLDAGVEVSEREYNEAIAAGKTNVVYGTMLGYGLTVELYNDKTPNGKGLRGLELPANSLEFDVRLRGALYLDGQVLVDGDGHPIQNAPYIWAYKENAQTEGGRPLGASSGTYNMVWDDEDEFVSVTNRAYNAAPYNTSGSSTSANNAAYSGGGWVMTGSQPAAGAQETTVHVKVSNYAFDAMDNAKPTCSDNGATSDYWAANYIKAFSAGYVQVIFPFNRKDVEDLSGYLEINMQAAAADLDIQSASGNPVGSSDTDMDKLKPYFGDDYAAHAVNEQTYLDNYVSSAHGFYIYSGSGDGDAITATNFYTFVNGGNYISGSDDNGSTPLMSQVDIGSTIYYHSREYHTDDPINFPAYYIPEDDFDPVTDNKLEYNYLTALNLLQKFDGDVFTPLATGSIINKRYNLNGQTNRPNGFHISTNEEKTTWSNTSPVKTQSYTLTVLYAAKPDGTNWEKIQYTEGNLAGKDDGGTADMIKYREENLVYYTSLADLQADGKVCVGILYQFRDMCIRNGRYIRVDAAMQVTDEFEMTGNTYATTHDVRGWSTYRPTYKEHFASNTLGSILYTQTWSAGGPALSALNTYIPLPNATQVANEDYFATATDTYTRPYMRERFITSPYAYDGYIKTQYADGNKVPGTHNGWLSGNSILLYTLDSNILIMNEDYVAGSGGTVRKTTYNVADYRVANFTITPTLKIASEVLKTHELVTNGSQTTTVDITLTIPKGLTYIPGSLTFDYSGSGYTESDLNWDVSAVTTNPDGSSTITFSTFVTDVEKKLPLISYATKIGDEWNLDNDVHDGDRLTTTAEIHTTYEETSQLASTSHTSDITIQIIKNTKDALFIDVDKVLTEINEPIGYILNYQNFSPQNMENVQLMDVLPYNGDGRGTEFHGGYRLDQLTMEFSDEESFQAFLNQGVLQIGSEKQTVPAATTDARNALLDTVANSGVTIPIASYDAVNRTITFDLSSIPESLLTTLATDSGAPALRAYLPTVSKTSTVRLHTTLTTVDSNGELIVDGNGETRTGGDVYYDSFYYKQGAAGVPTPSLDRYVRTVSRGISGFVWMDMDQDGLYTTADNGKRLKDVDVQVMVLTDGGWQQAKDLLGHDLTATTDANGAYSFANMGAGTYQVRFTDSDSGYKYKGQPGPLPFGQLSVTKLIQSQQQMNANRSIGNYDAASPIRLLAVTSQPETLKNGNLYTTVTMPAINEIPTWRYLSTNWNLGLYYIDLGLEKQWTEVVGDLPADATATFHVTGTVGSETVAEFDITMTKDAYSPTAQGAVYDTSVKTTDAETGLNTYVWTLKTIPMQAETQANGEVQKIVYTFTETPTSATRVFETPILSTVFADGITTFVAENPMKLSWLDLSKLVEGNMGNKEKEFTFTVTVTGVGNAKITTEGDVTQVEFKNDTATVKLKHGQHVKIPLPVGAPYTVTENGTFAYTVTYTVDGGEPATGRTTPSDATIPEAGVTIVYTNKLDIKVPTGVGLDLAVPVALVLLAAGGLVLMLLRKRRKAA